MKKRIIILCLPLFVFAQCKPTDQDDFRNLQPGVTRRQVEALAAKYGLLDSIQPGYTSPYFKPFPPEAYPALSEAFWDKYFANWRKFSDDHKEFLIYRQQLTAISSVAEYYRVIESNPHRRQSRIKLAGGAEHYNIEKSQALDGTLHVYIGEDGCVTTLPAASDKGQIRGRKLKPGQ